MSKSTCKERSRSKGAVGRKSAVLLSLLSVVHGRREHSEHLFDQMTESDHRDALTEIPADQLKSLLLNMLEEDEKPKKVPRPRKPDMRSPLETQKDQKNAKSKYQMAFDQRQKLSKLPNRAQQPSHPIEAFKESGELNQLSPIERSLEENRRQREYLLREYRQDGRIDDDELEFAESQDPLTKKERKRRKKEAKRALKAREAQDMFEQPPQAYPYPGQLELVPIQQYEPMPELDFDTDFWPQEQPVVEPTLFRPALLEREEDEDYTPVIGKGENFDVVNDGPGDMRDEWVQAPIQMGDERVNPDLHSWEDFDTRFEGKPLTQFEENQRELEQSKQEYFESLKRHADFEKKHPLEANAEVQPKHVQEPIPKEWEELTPAKRQKKENERHFQELQELKKAAEGENYKLPVPKKPERQEFKPSDLEDAEMSNLNEHIDMQPQHHAEQDHAPEKEEDKPEVDGSPDHLPVFEEKAQNDIPTKPDNDLGETLAAEPNATHDDHQTENALAPENDKDVDESDLNPYEKALRDNENHKKRFVEELKREAEERKQKIKEEKEAKEKEDRDHKAFLEEVWRDTEVMPEELKEIYAAEEAKRQEEEAKRRPEPPNAKTMRQRVAEESKRRKDAHMAKLRKQDEEEKEAKKKARDAETAKRRLTDPNYNPPPPLTVPKGKPAPPKDYKYPKKAREHGFGPPLDPDEEKEEKEKEEAEKKKNEDEKKAKELEPVPEEEKEKHHLPKPETKRPDPPKRKKKKDKKKKKKRQSKPSRKESKDKKTSKPKPEIAHKPVEENDEEEIEEKKPSTKKPKKTKQEPEHKHLKPRGPSPTKEKKHPKKQEEKPKKKSTKPKEESLPEKTVHPQQPHKVEEEAHEVEFSESEHHFDQHPHHIDYDRDSQYLDQFGQVQDREDGKLSWSLGSDSPSLNRHHPLHQREHEQDQFQAEPVPIFHHKSEHQQDHHQMREPILHHHTDRQPEHGQHHEEQEKDHHQGHLVPIVPDFSDREQPVDEAPAHKWHFKRGSDGEHEQTQKDIQDHKFLQLDKKTGQEHGRLAEQEQSSDSSFGAYQRQMAAELEKESHHPYRTRYQGDKSSSDDYHRYRKDGHHSYRSRSRSFDDRFHHYDRHHYDGRHEKPQHHERGRSIDDRDLKHKFSLDKQTEKLATLPWHKSDQSHSQQRKEHEDYEEKPHHGRHRNPQSHHDDKYHDRDRRYEYRGPESRKYYDSDDLDRHYEGSYREHRHSKPSRYESEPRRRSYQDDDYYRRPSKKHYDSRGRRYHSDDIHGLELDQFQQSYDYDDLHDRHYKQDKHQRRHSRRELDRDQHYSSQRHDDYRISPRHDRYYDDYDYDRHDSHYRPRQHHPSDDEKLYRSRRDLTDLQKSDERQKHRQRKAQKQRKRTKKQNPLLNLEPAKPVVQKAPQQPAQQFVIPSSHKQEETESEAESSQDDGQSQGNKKGHKKAVVPVMRRHGEPLMIMPEWQKDQEKAFEERAQEDEREHWFKEQLHSRRDYSKEFDRQQHSDSEKDFFEHEANPHRTTYPDHHGRREYDHERFEHGWKPHLNLAHSEQQEDDLAHAVIETFSKVMLPFPPQNQSAEDNELIAEANKDENKLNMPPLFHLYKDHGKLKARPIHKNDETSSQSSSSEEEAPKKKMAQESSESSSSSEQDSSSSSDSSSVAQKKKSKQSAWDSSSSEASSEDSDDSRDQESWVSDVSRAEQEGNSESEDEDSSQEEDGFDQYRGHHKHHEKEEEESYDSEEIADQFDKAMRMLRHHSHGFNLETEQTGDLIHSTTDYHFTHRPESTEHIAAELLYEQEQERKIQELEKRVSEGEYGQGRGNFDDEPEIFHHEHAMYRPEYHHLDRHHYTQPTLHMHERPFDSDQDHYYQTMAPMHQHYQEYQQIDHAHVQDYDHLFDRPSDQRRHNNLVPNFPKPEDNGKKKKDQKSAPSPHSPAMKEEMDYLAHQRALKDRSMRRKKQKQQPPIPKAPKLPPMQRGPPVLPVPSKDQVDPITGEPLLEGEQFDMMAYMKKQRLAKEKEMLKKERADPNYKPLSPTAHKPAVIPQKDRKKLHDAERKQRRQMEKETPDDKSLKDKSLFDQINKERMLRERKMREADPSYEPLSPTAHKPQKKKGKGIPGGKKGKPAVEEKEDTLFEQMQKLRSDHEKKLIEEDAKRAAEDPTYTPKFKSMPQPEVIDPNLNLKRRLEEERRKHREDYEEQFEDDLSEDELYDDESDFDGYGSEYGDELSSDDADYEENLDYYYDADGFAHPRRSKSKFGYDRYQDAYDLHYDPHRNLSYSDESQDDSDYDDSSSSDDSGYGGYGHYYDPHGRYGEPSLKRSNDKFDRRRGGRRYQQNGFAWGSLMQASTEGNMAPQESLVPSQELATDPRYHMPIKKYHLNLADETDQIDPITVAQQSDPQQEEGEIDELLLEVQKELHTRFKNMFEGEMLLPNLANNPTYEGKSEANLLNLEDGEESVEQDEPLLLQLAQTDNWLHSRSMWVPKGHLRKERELRFEDYQESMRYLQ